MATQQANLTGLITYEDEATGAAAILEALHEFFENLDRVEATELQLEEIES